MQINAKLRRRRNILTLVAISIELQASRRRDYEGVPRRFSFCRRLAGLFDPELAPTLWAYLAVDQRAGIRLLEQRTVAALLIALWRILVRHRGLAHFRGCLLERQQHSGGSRRAPCALQKNVAPRQCA